MKSSCSVLMCEIRVSEEPWSLWALMEKRCKNSCKMSNEGCKMTTKWHKRTATWRHSSAKQPEGDRKAALNYQKNNRAQDSDLSTDRVCVRHLLSSSERRRAHHLEPVSHHACERRRPSPSFVLANVRSSSCPWRWRALWHEAEQILTIRRPVNRREAGHRSDVQQVIVTPPRPATADLFTNPGAADRRLCPEVPVWRQRKGIHRRTLEGGEHKERLSLNRQARLLWFYITSCVFTSFQPAHNRFRFLKADSEKGWKDDSNNNSDTPCSRFGNCSVIRKWRCRWSSGGFMP